MIQLLLGLFTGVILEYLIHKYILHGLGKDKNSYFSFHWKHHQISRKNEFKDDSYKDFLSESNKKEMLSLFILIVANLPLAIFVPMFFVGEMIYLLSYYFLHRYCHLNPEFCKKYMPWHYEHHMGKDQDLNWNVVLPLDYLLNKIKEL